MNQSRQPGNMRDIVSLPKTLGQDIPAGFSIFMIALPLSIGIAVASGAPPAAGIIAAIIGGMIGSLCSGSRLAINGPAAGMIVIVAAAISELGHGDALFGFKAMLGCVVIAGTFQILLGLLRLGTLGQLFPITVVHGMLTAIGLIIISKQAHIALGMNGITGAPLELYQKLPESILHLNPAIAAIGAIALTTMLVWSKLGQNITRFVPAPLAAVLSGSAAGLYFDLDHPHLVSGYFAQFEIGPNFLLNVPPSLKSALYTPDFSLIGTMDFWKHTVMILLVASAESLLSTCAVDKIDPSRRRSNLNKELFGKGIVNVLCGLLGGLPVITEIVRSSANVSNGAKSQLSNFSHGLFMLVFLLIAPGLLHEIPLASLAAVLLVVGYRLASPKHFQEAFHEGLFQGVVFIVTVVSILATDLLMGVFIGTLLELIALAVAGRTLRLFSLNARESSHRDEQVIHVYGPVGFTNYMALKAKLDPKESHSRLTIDLRKSPIVDQTVKQHLAVHVADFAAIGKELTIKHSELM